ncbi:single-stranded DNA-binding protein [Nocardioides sp. Root190]|uniref:single-stranded DNA-binding protein n=1 Tax=Nocardioides sp. Root190 TaxID=1736488 RepID=UPI00191097CC|nr:single-stranded DNA-binding protein [Nocardioides sp. Root190]
MNSVQLQGRITGVPEMRELPSGDAVCVCRLAVARDEVRLLPSGRRSPSVDVIDLAGWTARLRRSMGGWIPGDQVQVEGAIRRRFYQAGGRTMSRVEVEVSSARRVRRART